MTVDTHRSRHARKLRIVVGGYLGLLPAGGVAWDYLQYVLGFAALGHDVWYVEDTGLWPVYQASGDGTDCSTNVSYLAALMADFGLSTAWAYRDQVSGQTFGLSTDALERVCASADLFVNVSCSTVLRDEYLRIPVRALLDSDPMFTQIQYITRTALDGVGYSGLREMVAAHAHHFTYGENVGAVDCRVPTCGVDWQPTRQPICLDHWPETSVPDDPSSPFTTVMNWAAAPPLVYDGERWGQKDVEFRRVLDLPTHVPGIPLAIAVGQTGGLTLPVDEVRRHGWEICDANLCVPDWRAYRRFIQRSRGELSVAKETYVQARTGWFSGRSACYLASGRPVVAQNTGWTRFIPSGLGALAFDDLCGAVEAVTRVTREPMAHARAARAIARGYFASERVLGQMLADLGLA